MSRLDHCFLLAAGRERAMVFCKADGMSREAARRQVEATLDREKGYPGYDLAYLGLLDYREMEEVAGSMLEPFEKLDPVWLVFFRWEGAPVAGTGNKVGNKVGNKGGNKVEE